MENRNVQFGFFLTPSAANVSELVQQAQWCDRLGLDLIGIQDHPYQYRFLDAWTLISYLVAKTERVRFFPDVSNLPLRQPAVLAKSAASLDVLSGGRVELGLGAGSFWQAINAMGGPNREPAEAIAALEDAIHIIRLVWSGQRGARYTGQHYQLRGANTGPVPAHAMQIWVGAVKPRMLALTGRLADGWVPSSSYVPPEALPEMNQRLDAAAVSAGRDPGQIRRIYNVMGRITSGERGGFLEGPASYWAETLVQLVEEGGMDTFIFAPAEPSEDQIHRFAEDVAPQVRAVFET